MKINFSKAASHGAFARLQSIRCGLALAAAAVGAARGCAPCAHLRKRYSTSFVITRPSMHTRARLDPLAPCAHLRKRYSTSFVITRTLAHVAHLRKRYSTSFVIARPVRLLHTFANATAPHSLLHVMCAFCQTICFLRLHKCIVVTQINAYKFRKIS